VQAYRRISNEAAWNIRIVSRPRSPAPRGLAHGIGGHPARLPRVSREDLGFADAQDVGRESVDEALVGRGDFVVPDHSLPPSPSCRSNARRMRLRALS